MNLIWYILTALGAFFAMEAVAWLSHKYLMHGWLWELHRDHHRKSEGRFLEKNDSFFVLFALPGIILFIISMWGYPYLLAIAIGITAYGFTYFILHDIFIHQRFPALRNLKWRYFIAMRRAHKVHHKRLDKHDGACFGMLIFPYKYYRESAKLIIKLKK